MADTIKILTPLQQMWHRPGMTIGSTDTPDTLLKEAVDNSIDELINSYANRVEITTKPKEGWYRIRDDGRGLPIEKFHTDNKDMQHLNGLVSTRVTFTKEFTSGKYDKLTYPYSVGTNGVGTKAMNVFSTKTVIRVKDKKNLYKGKMYELTLSWDKDRNQIVEEKWIDPKKIEDFWFSTEITIWPNPEVFKSLNARVRDLPLQVIKASRPEIQITVNDKDIEPFSFKENMESNILSNKIFSKKITYGTCIFDVSFAWCSKAFDNFYRGTVNLGSSNEGYHINEVRRAIGKAVCKFNESMLTPADGELGLRMFVNALVYEPMYTSQVKEKLSKVKDFEINNEKLLEKYKHLITIDADGKQNILRAKEAAIKANEWQDNSGFNERLTAEFYKALKQDEEFTNHLVLRLIEYKKSMNQLSDENYINDQIKTGADKVTRSSVKGIIEATSTDRKKCELFLCEGKSAGSPIKSGRNRFFQALFELRGKPMNVADSENSIKDIIENVEIKTIVNGIGIGMHPKSHIEDARYGKIIIATDADPDGLHIQGLTLGALLFLTPKIFVGAEDGLSMVYVSVAPLYKQGDRFIYDEKDLDHKKSFERFKGLGSMLPEDLITTVVNENTRKLKRINISEDRERALEIITKSSEKKRIMIDRGFITEEETRNVLRELQS